MTLERFASISRLGNSLGRLRRSFSRAKYYGDEAEMRRLRADILRLRRIILLRQEFFDLSPSDEVVTVETLLKRFS